MKKEKILVKLPEGEFQVGVLVFENEDKKYLFNVYKEWISLSKKLKSLKSRAVNLPEGLSESAFCLAMKDTVRVVGNISKANTSFDCYNTKTNERIQVKAASKIPDLTSFGPKSVWDKLYFLDFYREGNWDGSFDIYLIDNKYIYEHKVNKNQSFKDQQKQTRRPRFSIVKSIIKENKLKPLKTFNLSN